MTEIPRIAARCLIIALALLPLGVVAMADERDARIEELQREVQALRETLEQERAEGSDDARLDEIERRIEILAAEIEALRTKQPVAVADESTHGLGPAASKVYRTDKGVSLGGYGEVLYQNFEPTRDDGSPNPSDDTLDFLRAVLYFGYRFNDRFLFNSEIEFEHGTTSENGSVSVEFAYIDWLHREPLNVRAGLVLLPMGFLNELHEPTVFLSALRPETERRIIPSTWREVGAGVFGDAGPFTYRTYVVNGFDATGFSSGGLRGGRQSGSESKVDDWAWTGRLDWVGRPGLIAGASAYFGDSGQGLSDLDGTIDATTSILEAHVDWRWRGLQVRGLATRAEVDDVERLNAALGLVDDASIGETLSGSYIEAGFDIFAKSSQEIRLLPYVRWERIDTQDDVPSGFQSNPANDAELWTWGLAYQPIRQLIGKLEYRDLSNEADTGFGQVNANLGYVF